MNKKISLFLFIGLIVLMAVITCLFTFTQPKQADAYTEILPVLGEEGLYGNPPSLVGFEVVEENSKHEIVKIPLEKFSIRGEEGRGTTELELHHKRVQCETCSPYYYWRTEQGILHIPVEDVPQWKSWLKKKKEYVASYNQPRRVTPQ